MSPSRVAAVFLREWREILRDPLFFALVLLVPVTTLVVIAYGLTLDVENVPYAVVDQDRSRESRDYLRRFQDSRYFDLVGEVADERELERLLLESRIRFGLVIPPGFGRDLLAGRPAEVQNLIDGVIPYRAGVGKGYVGGIVARLDRELLEAHLARRAGVVPEPEGAPAAAVTLAPRNLFNPSLRSLWSMTSGMMMLVLMFSCPFLTALGVAREKETGAILAVLSSTVSRGEYLLGKLLPYVLLSSVNVLVLWSIVLWLYGTPFRGDPFVFLLGSIVFVACATGIGLLVALQVRTQAAAALLSMVVSMIPAMLYSGLLVPIESMGEAAALEARLFPAATFLRFVWGAFLKGFGWREQAALLLHLALYAAAVWTLGWFSFSKRPRR